MNQKKHLANLQHLFDKAQSGDLSSLGRLLQSYNQMLYRIAQEELGVDLVPKGSASDLVQDTFLEAHRAFNAFRGDISQFRNWLQEILTNNLNDFCRRFRQAEKREVSRELSLEETDPIHLEAQQESPVEAVLRAEELQILEGALVHLSPSEQQLMRWRFRDSMTHEQIGRCLGCTENAARQRVNRALQHWQDAMRSYLVA